MSSNTCDFSDPSIMEMGQINILKIGKPYIISRIFYQYGKETRNVFILFTSTEIKQ